MYYVSAQGVVERVINVRYYYYYYYYYTNLWKTWPLWNSGQRLLSKIVQENASQKSDSYWTVGQNTALSCTTTRPMKVHQYWTAPDRHKGRSLHPSQRSGGCSTIVEKREVSWSRQHPRRTGPSRWRGCNHRSHDNLQQDLADWRMANPVDPVLSHHTSQERQPAAVPELPNNQPHQSPKQRHVEDHTEQIEAISGEDHRWRTDRL